MMNNTPDKCPGCGTFRLTACDEIIFDCGSMLSGRHFHAGPRCLTTQRDQQTARAEKAEALLAFKDARIVYWRDYAESMLARAQRWNQPSDADYWRGVIHGLHLAEQGSKAPIISEKKR